MVDVIILFLVLGGVEEAVSLRSLHAQEFVLPFTAFKIIAVRKHALVGSRVTLHRRCSLSFLTETLSNSVVIKALSDIFNRRLSCEKCLPMTRATSTLHVDIL